MKRNKMIINPKDYPNTSALFGFTEDDAEFLVVEHEEKGLDNLKKEIELERKSKRRINSLFGFKS